MTLSIHHLSTLPHGERYNEVDVHLPEPARTAMFNVFTRMPNWRRAKALDVRDWTAEQARHILARNPDVRWRVRAQGFYDLAKVVED
jgi:hypothetical protein